jgi:hypothetical protein
VIARPSKSHSLGIRGKEKRSGRVIRILTLGVRALLSYALYSARDIISHLLLALTQLANDKEEECHDQKDPVYAEWYETVLSHVT